MKKIIGLSIALFMLCASGALARPPALRWEKLRITNAQPSQIFARLGLTHSTRNGRTRDGKKGVPDPGFPMGLTDVVPSDTDHFLIIRGTEDGRTQFRRRVASLDVVVKTLHGTVELVSGSDPTGIAVASKDLLSVIADRAFPVTLNDANGSRQYQINVHVNPNGWYLLSLRRGISLVAPPSSGSAVYVPSLAFTDPVTKLVRPGDAATYADTDDTVRITLNGETTAHH